jgi:hypothetical protein
LDFVIVSFLQFFLPNGKKGKVVPLASLTMPLLGRNAEIFNKYVKEEI